MSAKYVLSTKSDARSGLSRFTKGHLYIDLIDHMIGLATDETSLVLVYVPEIARAASVHNRIGHVYVSQNSINYVPYHGTVTLNTQVTEDNA